MESWILSDEEIMKLQVALDCFDLSRALKILEQIHEYVDIAEIGTPLMYAAGAAGVREVKKAFPKLWVLADMKIMDGGEPISSIAYEAGADIVTVCGATNDNTISGVVGAAKRFGKMCFVDLISVDDVEKRAGEADALGADFVSVHTSYDMLQSVATPLEDLKILKRVLKNAKPAISGGINLDNVDDIISIGPEVVIAGSAMVNAKEPAGAARAFRGKIDAAAM